MAPLPDLTKPPVPRAVEPIEKVVASPSTWKCSGLAAAVTEPPLKPVLPALTTKPPLVLVRVLSAPLSPKSCPEGLCVELRLPPLKATPPPLFRVRLWTVVACWKIAEAAVTKLAVAVAPKVSLEVCAPPVVAALRVTVLPETELITEFAATPVPLTAMPAKRPEASATVMAVALLMLAGSTTPVPAEEASRPRYSAAVSRRKPLAS